MLDALEAVAAAGVGTREDFYWTLHAVFVKRHEHSVLFDQAFRMFFRKRAYLDKLLAMLSPQAPAAAPEPPQAGAQRVQEALFSGMNDKKPPEEREIELDARLTMSDREVLQKKDFAQMSAAEIAQAKDAIKRMVLPLDEVKTRRLAPHRRGHIIDMRRTLARQHEGGRRADRPEISRRQDQAAADRRAARYFRLDEPVHAAVPAFPSRGDRCAQARALVPVRHAAHQCDARAQIAAIRTRR